MSFDPFKARVVWLILDGNPEEALRLLGEKYQIAVPEIKVGLPKKLKLKAYGCYTAKNNTIYVRDSDIMVSPLVILHEFYHHLRSRSVDKVHRGTEDKADQFAKEYVLQYQMALKESQKSEL
ncbi:MAG: hypothetical protein LBH79_06925 [Nitrososphaerota archaeon]|jgi:hypothetical protein|nr:hypothetical protein [Nitrososphaerota archaeon]